MGRISGRQWGIPMAASGENHMARSRKPQRVVLAPGRRAYFLVAKYRCDGGVLNTATLIRVVLPGSRGDLTIRPNQGATGLDYCKRYVGDQPIDPGNHVTVSPVEPSAGLTQPLLG
jgi:hypothetical protein